MKVDIQDTPVEYEVWGIEEAFQEVLAKAGYHLGEPKFCDTESSNSFCLVSRDTGFSTVSGDRVVKSSYGRCLGDDMIPSGAESEKDKLGIKLSAIFEEGVLNCPEKTKEAISVAYLDEHEEYTPFLFLFRDNPRKLYKFVVKEKESKFVERMVRNYSDHPAEMIRKLFPHILPINVMGLKH